MSEDPQLSQLSSEPDGPPEPTEGPPYPPARRAGWPGLRDARSDLRAALLTVLVLALSGLPAGVLWWWLAPRADFTVTADGPVANGDVSQELLVSDDVVFLFVTAGLGLLAGLVVWFALRRHRGAPVMVALAAGVLAAAVVARELGELLGRGPTAAQLSDVGRTVTTAVQLDAVAAIAIGPFVAVLVYLLCSVFAADDDLGRSEPGPLHAAPAHGSGLDPL